MTKLLSDEDRPNAVMDKKYYDVHHWLKKKYGKASKCISLSCTGISTNYEWANIDGIYEYDIKHFVELCRSCHAKSDIRESTRLKMADAARKTLNAIKKPVRNITTGEEFPSVASGARSIEVTTAAIIFHFVNNTDNVKGNKWEYINE